MGWSAVVFADLCSFLLSALLIGAMPLARRSAVALAARRRARPPVRGRSLRRDWLLGLDAMRRMPGLSALFTVAVIDTLSGACFSTLMVPYVRILLHGQAMLLGWLASAQGGGSVAASVLLVPFASRVAPRRLLAAGFALAGVVLIVCFSCSRVPVLIVLWAAAGALVTLISVTRQTLLQLFTDDATRGRVLGALGMLNGLARLVGAIGASSVAALLGIRPALYLVAGLAFLAACCACGIPGDDEGGAQPRRRARLRMRATMLDASGTRRSRAAAR
jgi:Na+/melibiose symporter-like transporter